ncbi:Uncharacterized protein dnl_04130 [Desulfonema limicola]|uniref:Uncharacterized protein n=1 Tax=Desulfonema limicola TaxID=45656 RepID=A0A975B3M9_9BACT|nr:hypothetical protein [Desulfonema limicola]QTA78197.1 Uncharacterized protein dnl_04130 [Desulfonema limicola]
MNILSLIPSADPVPVEWGWFKLFLILTFAIHILLVNIMLGTGIIAWINGLRQDTTGSLIPVQKDVAAKLPVIIALAINFGVAPFLFLQVLFGQFIYVSSQLMAVYWLSVIAVLIIAYYAAYFYKFNFDSLNEQRSIMIGTSVILLLFIGFIFSNNISLMLNPKAWAGYFLNPDGLILNLSDPALVPRYLHFITASLAVGGLFIAVVWTLKKDKGENARENIELGMKWFGFATLFQIIIGFWFQMSLPKDIMQLFLGSSLPHTALFAAALFLVLQTLYFSFKKQVWPCVFSLSILVFAMIIIRDEVRTAYLSPYFKVSDLEVTGQYSPFILFAVCLAVVSGLIIYVLGLAVKAEKNSLPQV